MKDKKTPAHFKVEWYDYRAKMWRVAQKRFASEAGARHYGIAIGSRHRVVKVTAGGRTIV